MSSISIANECTDAVLSDGLPGIAKIKIVHELSKITMQLEVHKRKKKINAKKENKKNQKTTFPINVYE